MIFTGDKDVISRVKCIQAEHDEGRRNLSDSSFRRILMIFSGFDRLHVDGDSDHLDPEIFKGFM